MSKWGGLAAAYLYELAVCDWADIAWGLERGLLSRGDVVRFARCKVSEHSSPAEVALAILEPPYEWSVPPALEAVVAEEGSQRRDSGERWLFATLLYAAENASTRERLIQTVDEIYCDFDHPDAMYGFVSWNPPLDGYDPSAHTDSDNRDRIVRQLQEYLRLTADRLGGREPKQVPRV